MEMAATCPVSGNRLTFLASTKDRKASCKATQAPVIEAVRVPPSAWITSQSTVTMVSPMAFRSTTVRRLRPIRRSISIERPLRPRYSRGVRLLPEAGSMAYSAVTQPACAPLRQRGTVSSTVAAQITFVSPNSTMQEPAAFLRTLRVSVTGRSWSKERS